jgi:3'(2'), 5'-bisphosphate nucleotidase
MSDAASLLEIAAGLARRAAVVILTARSAGFEVRAKRDSSLVTDADLAAAAVIVRGLRKACPEIPVVSEEARVTERGFVAAGWFWLVDPLDGTREFAAGLSEFTVNIALVVEHRVRLGVVALPATGGLYGGRQGDAAWREDAKGRRCPINARRPPDSGSVVLASRHHADARELAGFLVGRRVARLERVGSALKVCRVAEGGADLYPRLGRTMEWDTAAPQAVLEAAGGRLETLDGAAMRYGKPDFTNPSFVCRGRA